MINGNKTKIMVLLLIIIIPLFIITAQSADLNINLRVSATPSIQNIQLYSDDDGGTTTAVDTLTPYDEMTLYFEVVDPDISEGDTINEIKVEFYYQSKPANTAPDLYVVYLWNGTAWNVDDGITDAVYSDFKWLIDATNTSITVDTVNNKYIVKLVFTPSKIAIYDNSLGWVISISATDSTGNVGTGNTNKNCALYVEYVSVNPSTVSGFIAPDGQAHLIIQTAVTVEVIVNANFTIKFTSPGWYNTSDVLVYDLTQIKIFIDNETTFNGDEYQVTTNDPSLANGWNTFTRTMWDGAPQYDNPTFYVFIVADNTVIPGDYHTTLTITVSV